MKTSIQVVLFALLLAFAAPVPLAETLTGQEQESVCIVSRPVRGTVRPVSQPKPEETGRVEPPPPAPLRDDSALPVRLAVDGIPPAFCRPPPL